MNTEHANPTLYLQNLNEKVRIPDLKNALTQLFTNVGVSVREVHAKKNIKMRGQAFVVCEDEDQAANGLKKLRGHLFFGKPLRINYSRKPSDSVLKAQGKLDEEVLAKRKEGQ